MKSNKDSKLKQKREIVKKFIRNHPSCTYLDIKRATKLKIERLYKNMKEAYKDANVKLSKNLTKRDKGKQKKDVLDFIKNNPGCGVIDIHEKVRVNVIRNFGSITRAYKLAGVPYPKKEITSGVMNPYVIARCNKFEKRIIEILSKLGKVNPKVRTTAGIIDCVLKYKDEKYIVEIKDFRSRNNITMSQLKQLIKYMKSINCQNGLLICPKESFPKRKNSRNIYIDELNIKILSEEDLRGRSINFLA